MHELSLMRDLLRRIAAVAGDEQATRVLGVRIQLGALCHMSAEHFREHFEQAARGTVAEGAALELDVRADPAAPDAQDILLTGLDIGQLDFPVDDG